MRDGSRSRLTARSSFERPDDFVPERWLSDSPVRTDTASMLAFSSGRASCIGRELAMRILRRVTANIVLHFELTALRGFDADAYRAHVKDFYAPEIAPLPVTVNIRQC